MLPDVFIPIILFCLNGTPKEECSIHNPDIRYDIGGPVMGYQECFRAGSYMIARSAYRDDNYQSVVRCISTKAFDDMKAQVSQLQPYGVYDEPRVQSFK